MLNGWLWQIDHKKIDLGLGEGIARYRQKYGAAPVRARVPLAWTDEQVQQFNTLLGGNEQPHVERARNVSALDVWITHQSGA